MSLRRPAAPIALACLLALTLGLASAFAQRPQPGGGVRETAGDQPLLTFRGAGHTVYGDWQATIGLDASSWRPRQAIAVSIALRFSEVVIRRDDITLQMRAGEPSAARFIP